MAHINNITYEKKAKSLWQLTERMRSVLFKDGEDKFEESLAPNRLYNIDIFNNSKIEHHIESDILLAILIYKVLKEKSVLNSQKIIDFYFEILCNSIIDNVTILSTTAFAKSTIAASTDIDLIFALNKIKAKGRVLKKDTPTNQKIDIYTPAIKTLRDIEVCKRIPLVRNDLASFINERLKSYSIELNSLFKKSAYPFVIFCFLYENPLSEVYVEVSDFWQVHKLARTIKNIHSVLELEVPDICES
ncbi:hypothetical protein [Spirosoma pollinicola]|uniref:Uncharacterized protein n=1 Tax=Spirosoma pollinicola TaxID=2057025 RepID=A0A2K8YTI5_9BACT|nr:hypothetical protein [Spirosoma pollinicola]AUD00878.1 hypothetical protein CWM47_03035 [Spirosoma pollinicola]